MDTINSLLNNGECLHLFSNDEMDGLYQAVGPSIKREYPNIVIDPKKFFNTRVKKNLHICLSITPHSKIFSQIVRDYSGILNNCQIYWICDWQLDSLIIEAKYFMRNRLESEELRNKISQSMCDIHFFMLKECRQIPWAGSFEKDIKIQQTKIVEKKKEQISKTITIGIPNWPYSKNILQEQIKLVFFLRFYTLYSKFITSRLEHVPTREKSKLHFFIGPNTYRKFMNSFWYFFTTKAKQCENDIIRLRRVLDTLAKTRNDSKEMKVYIKDLKARCKQAEIDSEQLLHKLIEKTTDVEKLKAKFGRGGSLATLMQMHENINDDYDVENEQKLLLDEELDEYDREFVRMKEESLKSKQSKLLEELEQARHVVEDCKRALTDKRKQVWILVMGLCLLTLTFFFWLG
jgi:dynein heavy chain